MQTVQRNTLNETVETVSSMAEKTALAALFERFSDASSKLEARYEVLRRETEELRARLKEKDEEISRQAGLAMLGETAAAIAHEVRNPLGSIKLFASLLRSDIGQSPQSGEILDGIDRSIVAIENVVSNILHFARSQKPVMAPLNLHSLIQEQVKAFVPLQEGKISVELCLKAVPWILGNEHGLRQIFGNLLHNAVQVLKRGGKIKISTWTEAGKLRAEVRDNGPGFPQDILPKVFEPFVTSRNEGTGLGLAIVKKILLQHGGSVEAGNDSVNGGAVLSIALPQTIREETGK